MLLMGQYLRFTTKGDHFGSNSNGGKRVTETGEIPPSAVKIQQCFCIGCLGSSSS